MLTLCQAYQQPLDLHIAEGERVFFKVSGNFTVHLTGNYEMPIDEHDHDDEDDELDDDEYDLSPNEDELAQLEALVAGEESDDLDDLEDPRVMEIDGEEEAAIAKKTSKKGKNKRPAEDDAEVDASLDDIMAKSLKEEQADQPKQLSKAEKKAAKKLKNNEGEASAAPVQAKAEPATNGTSSDSDKKKVQFAKNLEQGPTPSKADAKDKDKKSASVSLGIKDVSGISVDDRKIGSGPPAKKGSRLEMRYIGKLDNGKVFDSNKSGKPFAFKLGTGEVIKGWDLGLAGISAGGERRLIIPAHHAYGKKALPGIPANSRLTFDIKCLSVKQDSSESSLDEHIAHSSASSQDAIMHDAKAETSAIEPILSYDQGEANAGDVKNKSHKRRGRDKRKKQIKKNAACSSSSSSSPQSPSNVVKVTDSTAAGE